MKAGTYTNGIRTLDDLRARCHVDEDTECWSWRLCTSHGAPHVRVVFPDGSARVIRGRRAAAVLAERSIPKGHQVYAKVCCRNPLCVNPEHCNVGTKRQAGAALAASGVLKGRPGIRAIALARTASRRKLTDEMAADIRASSESPAELAKRYGVVRSQIYNIRNGVTYRQAGYSIFSAGCV